MADEPRVPQRDWDPKSALEGLIFEAQLDGGDSPAATSRILREHALIAAQSICHLAAYASTERVRLQAAEWIVERVLEERLDQDIRLAAEQQKLVGQALYGAVRALGLQFGFDPEDQMVRTVTRDAILAVATESHGSGG
jgi:hypothetical protein